MNDNNHPTPPGHGDTAQDAALHRHLPEAAMTGDGRESVAARRERRWYLTLLALPFVWQLGLAGVANMIALRPFGLPFQLVWQMAGIVVSTLSIALVFHCDNRRERTTGTTR